MDSCLFCRRPIAFETDSWEYEGNSFPVHPMCKTLLEHAAKDYAPIAGSANEPRCWGYANCTYQDFYRNWHSYPEDMQTKLFAEFKAKLEKVLDVQEVAIHAYCSKIGLPEPTVYREIASKERKLLYYTDMFERSRPGDHVIVPHQLKWSRIRKNWGIGHTYDLAHRLAQKGVTFHCVYHCIDWSVPLCQHFVRLAHSSNLKARRANINPVSHEDGKVDALYGYSWEKVQKNKIFQWVIACIRDKGMSPMEVARAARSFYCVFSWDRYKVNCIAITRDREAAQGIKSQEWRQCFFCRQAMLARNCPVHTEAKTFRMKVRSKKGIVFVKRQTDFDEVAAAIWAWYCEHFPEQEKVPWKSRITVDKRVR